MPVIEVENLKKEYKINVKKEGLRGALLNLVNPKYEIKQAVKGVNFSIEEGEMVGYIGSNGAGKSTTIKMLTGVLTPTSGKVLVNGIVPHNNRMKNNINIGAVFGQRTQMWWDIPVIESYKLIQKIYEIPYDKYKKNLDYFIEYLDLKELLHIPVRQLSLGQKMRCEIAAAFIHEPKIVYLDEPTIGLDFIVKEKIREFIKIINRERNTTVILTTHDLQDIEEICSRIIIIDNGQIIYDGSIEEVKNKFSEFSKVNFKIKNYFEDFDKVLAKHARKIEIICKEEHGIEIRFNRRNISVADVIKIISQNANIVDLSIHEDSIETIVKNLYEKKLAKGV